MISHRRTLRILGQSLLALTMGSAIAYAQAPKLPLSYQNWLQLRNNPAALSNLQSYPAPAVPRAAAGITVGPWQSVTPLPASLGNVSPANPLLMTDGTVIVHLIDDTHLRARGIGCG
jgi:hypothetical protein